MILFSVRHSSAVRGVSESPSDNGALIAEGAQLKDFSGEQAEEEFPECFEIAQSTYPGFCNPEASAYACYSMHKALLVEDTPVDVHWACSEGFSKEAISKAECSKRPWNYRGTVNGKRLDFTAGAGIYAGACQFSTLPQQKTKYSEFPDCRSVMETYPGGCNPKNSAFACYNRKEKTSSELPSYCSDKLDKGWISEGNCVANGYAGACQFESSPDLKPTAPKEADPDTTKSPQDLPSTAPKQAGPDTTKSSQDLPSTTTEQAGPATTKKNAAAGGATGFLLAACIGLVHLLHPKP